MPILFALSTPVEGKRLSYFPWLDGIQALFAGYLTYLTIFSVLPFSRHPGEPISIAILVVVYNVENVVLAGGCVVRMMASPQVGEERRFYRTLAIFLVTNGLAVAVYNYLSMISPDHSAPDLLANVPFVLLAGSILLLPAEQAGAMETEIRKGRLALFIDIGSPVFFTLALLALGLAVLRVHFYTGVVAIGVGLVVYGLRTTTLQTRYIQTQLELQKARDRLEELSLRDGLTGIANRRSFDQTLDSEWHRAMRTHAPLSLLLIDLDFFKAVNDLYGHPFGDRCLTKVAQALSTIASRSGDLVARYGGEEFAVILPVTSLEAAEALAEKMRQAVLDLKIPNLTDIGPFVSISIGVARYLYPESGSPAMLIESADRALYKAKMLGRNRVEVSSIESPSLS